jgi:hypothetical protein
VNEGDVLSVIVILHPKLATACVCENDDDDVCENVCAYVRV